MADAKSYMPEIEQDIDYLLFVDNAESMENFTHLRPMVNQLADLFRRRAEKAMEEYEREIRYQIAHRLRDTVAGTVMKQEPAGDIYGW